MNLPGRIETIINELYNRNISLAKGSDDDRRALTMIIVQQIRYEFGPKWGTKRADAGRPPSKDSIAFFDPPNLWAYDWQNGSTRAPHKPIGHLDLLTKQVFIPVEPVNHLATEGQNPPVLGQKSYNELYAVQFGEACNEIYINSGRAFDPGMIAVHATRAAYDYYIGGMAWSNSFKKHINDFRAEYGLPPV